MARKAKIGDDLSRRVRELLTADEPVVLGKNDLDKNREPFSLEERDVAKK